MKFRLFSYHNLSPEAHLCTSPVRDSIWNASRHSSQLEQISLPGTTMEWRLSMSWEKNWLEGHICMQPQCKITQYWKLKSVVFLDVCIRVQKTWECQDSEIRWRAIFHRETCHKCVNTCLYIYTNMPEYFVHKQLETHREIWEGVRRTLSTRFLICTYYYY